MLRELHFSLTLSFYVLFIFLKNWYQLIYQCESVFLYIIFEFSLWNMEIVKLTFHFYFMFARYKEFLNRTFPWKTFDVSGTKLLLFYFMLWVIEPNSAIKIIILIPFLIVLWFILFNFLCGFAVSKKDSVLCLLS